MERQGELIVISGPSGSGKTTICEWLLEEEGIERVVTCTTRAPRGEEVDGIDYHFSSREAFEAGIDANRFLEYANVYGNYYGTPREAVEAGIRAGKTLLLNIDVQGARQLRESAAGNMRTVFIDVPDLKTLEARLRKRGSDDDATIRKRIEIATEELKERVHYDHVVMNDDLDRAVEEVRRLLKRR